LRAFAVLAVVIYHLWPRAVPGGFVGVDVFFVISGFLIVGHLVREIQSTGRLKLGEFWARRARRLLPASLLVIGVTALVTVLLVPDVYWRQWFQEMGASTVYVQNWLLAANSVDYLATDNKSSPVQHFWSLSVEEQFYIVLPLIIVGVLLLARLMKARSPLRLIGTTLAVITVGSFAYSAWGVATDLDPTYFVTHSRAWEFGAGGLLAMLPAVSGLDRVRAAAAWAGIVGLTATVFVYTARTPFPGAAALLPVAATLAVIWAGSPNTRWSPQGMFGAPPVQWIGDVSYSLYLWHWPPLVILPIVLGQSLDLVARIGILAGSLVLAVLTKRYVEDAVRTRSPLVRRPPWVTLVATVAATGLMVTLCFTADVVGANRIEAAAAQADAAIRGGNTCVGAFALAKSARCDDVYAVTKLTNPAFARADIGKGVQLEDECKQSVDSAKVITCRIGEKKNPSKIVALVGDSHAGHWLEPLDIYGKEHGIQFVTMLKTWCAGTAGTDVFLDGGSPASRAGCTLWGKAVLKQLLSAKSIDAVLFANYTHAYQRPYGDLGRALRTDDFLAVWRPLLKAGKTVIALRDTPRAQTIVPDCIAQNEGEYDPCTTPREVALLPEAEDPQLAAAERRRKVEVIDLTNQYCGPSVCHSVIGGLIVYFDDHHMTASFARTMAPQFGRQVSAALR
jgi:peptidoglycan/LPS O-acetylase OafA/YrhL